MSEETSILESPASSSGSGLTLKLELEKSPFSEGSLTFLRSARITEAISKPFRAVVEILSDQRLQRTELQKLISQTVKLTLGRGGEERVIAGQITGFRTLGLISGAHSSSLTSCSRYEAVIEPGLALLAKNRRTRCFKEATALEVIRSILNEHDLPEGPDQDDSRIPWNGSEKAAVYMQSDESDLSFITKLALLYGVNYCFRPPEGDGLSEPIIALSTTLSFSETLDNQLVSSCGTNGEPVLSLEHEEHVSAASSGIFYGEAADSGVAEEKALFTVLEPVFRYARTKGDFSSEADLQEAAAADRSRIRQALRARSEAFADSWSGQGDRLAIEPGRLLVIKEFFAEEDESHIAVSSAELFFRAVWPSELTIPPEEENEASECFQQSFRAISIPSDRSLCGSLADLPDDALPARGPQRFASAQPALLRGTIAEDNAHSIVDSKLDSSDVPSIFFVKIPGAETPLPAELAQFRIDAAMPARPKLGDSVLIAASQGRLYILGSLESERTATNSKDMLAKHTHSTAQILQTAEDGSTANALTLTPPASSFSAQQALDMLLAGTLDSWFTGVSHQLNSTSLLSDWLDMKSKADTVLKDYRVALANYEAAVSANTITSKDFQNFSTKLSNAVSALSAVAEEAASLAEKNSASTLGGISLFSKADIVTSAACQHISADNCINITGDQTVNINATNIVLGATESIQIAVGGNKISIDRNGLNIISNKWMHSALGPFDAAIRLDSASGITITGMSCSMSGVLAASITDGFGGAYSLKYGTATISANKVDQKTNVLVPIALKLASLGTRTVLQLGAISEKASSALNATINFVSFIEQSGNYAIGLQATKNSSGTWHDSWPDAIIEILDSILSAFETVISLVTAIDSSVTAAGKKSFLAKNAAGSTTVSNRDAIRLTITSFKMVIAITTMAALMPKLIEAHKAAKVTLQQSTIKEEGSSIKKTSQEDDSTNGPVAGNQTPEVDDKSKTNTLTEAELIDPDELSEAESDGLREANPIPGPTISAATTTTTTTTTSSK